MIRVLDDGSDDLGCFHGEHALHAHHNARRIAPARSRVDAKSDRAETERNVPALALARPRIPVVSGPRLLEMAGLERVLALLEAPNAVSVRVRKTQAIAGKGGSVPS